MKTYGKLQRSAPSQETEERYGMRKTWFVFVEPHVAVKLKRWFPRARADRAGYLVLTDTPEVASDLEWMLLRWPLELDEADRAHLERRAREYDEARDAVHRILELGEPLTGEDWLEPALPPKGQWQTAAADLVLTRGRVCCADELGLGKTFQGLLVLRDPRARPGLVVCPPHLQRQWLRELGKFFPQLTGHIIRKSEVYDPATVRGAPARPDLLIISYSKLAKWADHLAGQVQTVIFDEAHELRRSQSQKYWGAERVAAAADFRMQLTGTPVFNYGGDAHTILRVIDRDALGTRDEFVREWGADLGRGKVGVREPRALGTYLRDQALLVRRTHAEVGEDKPGAERIAHEVDFNSKLLDELLSDTAELAQFILAGQGDRKELFRARGDLDWRMRRATGLAKAPYVAAFVKLLLEQTDKVVLWGWHRDVYEVWLEKLGQYQTALYTGSESPRQKDLAAARFIGGERLEQFNDEDLKAGRVQYHTRHQEARVLIMSLRSGAGLDGLQEVCHVGVFGELDWSPAQHDQCIGRLDRDGQEERVLAYFLNAPDGSDPVVMEVLGIKREQSELIRDPSLELLKHANDTTDRIRLLAERALRERGLPVELEAA